MMASSDLFRNAWRGVAITLWIAVSACQSRAPGLTDQRSGHADSKALMGASEFCSVGNPAASFRSAAADPTSTLLRAVWHLDVPCVKALLNRGVDPDPRIADGSTALLLAARRNSNELVQLLLEYGANTRLVNSGGVAPLAVAAGEGHSTIVQQLLQAGAPIDAVSLRGWSALHHAVAGNRHTVVSQLLDAGSAADLADVNGTTSLMLAAAACADCIDALLSGGADPNVADQHGVTALMVAAQHHDSRVVERLIAVGARIEIEDHSGRDFHDWAAIGAR